MIRHQSAMIVSIYIEIGASFFIMEVGIKNQVRRPSCILTVYVDVTSNFVYRKKNAKNLQNEVKR